MSENELTHLQVEVKDPEGKLLMVQVVNSKQFKTGSSGFHASTKMTTGDGKRYQVNLQFVEIGSKPA